MFIYKFYEKTLHDFLIQKLLICTKYVEIITKMDKFVFKNKLEAGSFCLYYIKYHILCFKVSSFYQIIMWIIKA